MRKEQGIPSRGKNDVPFAPIGASLTTVTENGNAVCSLGNQFPPRVKKGKIPRVLERFRKGPEDQKKTSKVHSNKKRIPKRLRKNSKRYPRNPERPPPLSTTHPSPL